jgi:hypothetical protein
MGRKNVELIEIQKEYEIVDKVLNRYNPVLSAREIHLNRLSDDIESNPFNYTEEDNSYNRLGL